MAAFKRKLYYLGGFDPRGVRYYYGMFVEQMQRLATLSENEITVSRRSNTGRHRTDWTVTNHSADAVTDYSFLRWEDLVLQGWVRHPVELVWRAAQTYALFWRHFDFRRVRQLGRGPLITLFYPPVFAVLLPLIIGAAIFGLASLLLPWWLALPLGVVLGVAGTVPLLRMFHALWLLRFFIFNSDLSAGRIGPELEERLAHFAGEILKTDFSTTGEDRYDEILLVTHSNGSILSVPLMTRLLEHWGGAAPANFRLVSLGHCIPLVACRRDAVTFRAQLAALGTRDFRWIDIGSPPDGAGYYGVNPLLIYGTDPQPQVELLSPRFHLFYDPASYHGGWRNKYEIHFDYLRTGDRVSPLTLPSIASSPQSIDAAVVQFRAIA